MMAHQTDPAINLSAAERAALDFARQEFCWYRDNGSPWSAGSALSPTASHAMVQFFSRSAGRRAHAYSAGHAGAARLARCRRCAPPHHFGISKPASALPSELAAWDMEMRMFGLPTPWAGPKRASRMLRDPIVTVTTLAVVDQFGLPLTTRSPRRRNACEIVAMALGSVGSSIGHKGVGTDAPASRLLLAGRRCSGFNSDLYGRTHNRTASITWNQTWGGRLYSATIAPGQSRESPLTAGGIYLPPIRSAVCR
jgi:hypothetical protein